jgi:hypothetical protein
LGSGSGTEGAGTGAGGVYEGVYDGSEGVKGAGGSSVKFAVSDTSLSGIIKLIEGEVGFESVTPTAIQSLNV